MIEKTVYFECNFFYIDLLFFVKYWLSKVYDFKWDILGVFYAVYEKQIGDK